MVYRGGIVREEQWKLVTVMTGSFEFEKGSSDAKVIGTGGELFFF